VATRMRHRSAGLPSPPHDRRPRTVTEVTMKLAMILAVLLFASAEAQASCATMQKLAQEHSNDMARRGSMDHAGFMDRARRGARAENVAMGVKTRSAAVAMWWSSPGHAANMRVPGCKAVAYAVGRGVYYWTMEIGR
jgi:urease accessory protein UreF